MSSGSERTALPVTWAIADASEACEKIQDGTHFSPKDQLPEGRFRYITAKNVRPAGLDLSDVTYLSERDHRQIFERCDVRKGDVLLVKDGVNAGDAAVNTLDEEISLLSSVSFLRPRKGLVTSEFLRYYLLSPLSQGTLTANLSGTAIRRIVLRRVRELPIRVAPLREQARIVEEVEKQFTRLDAAVAGLQRVKANLKRYRASVLKAACEGRLVPTEAELARREGRSFESGEELLKRILKERRARWEADQVAKMKAAGKGSGDDGWKARYSEPALPVTGVLSPCPMGWTVASLEQITSQVRPICYGILMPKENFPGGVPYVKVKDMKGDRIDVQALHRTHPSIAAAYARASLQAGDVLLAIRGTFGRVAEVPEGLDGTNITQDTARLAVSTHLDRRWIAWVLRSKTLQHHFEKVARGVAVKGVNIGDVRPTPVPVPPLPEQHRIVIEVERRLSVVDELEATVEKNLVRCARLRQSILKMAFEGRLVPQDPNDEPASVLLDRIREERGTEEPRRRGVRRTPRP